MTAHACGASVAPCLNICGLWLAACGAESCQRGEAYESWSESCVACDGVFQYQDESGKWLSSCATGATWLPCAAVSMIPPVWQRLVACANPDTILQYNTAGQNACKSTQDCVQGTTFERAPPTRFDDRICSDVNNCGRGEYQAAPPTLTTNRVCAKLTVCNPARQYSQSQITTAHGLGVSKWCNISWFEIWSSRSTYVKSRCWARNTSRI